MRLQQVSRIVGWLFALAVLDEKVTRDYCQLFIHRVLYGKIERIKKAGYWNDF
jgi:hypothetical protein